MAAFNTRRTCRQNEAFIAYITVKTMPDMLQKLIPKEVNPAFICTSYSHNKNKYKKALKLSEKEQHILLNLRSDGFRKCDTPLLYKLCQYYDLVNAPVEGWGKFNKELRNIGDAVEAIVKLRSTNLRDPTQDLKEITDKMVEIAKLIDKEISNDKRFEEALRYFSVDKIGDKCIEKCKTAFQQITEEVKGTFKDDVLEGNEQMCFDEDYHSNIVQNPIVLSPTLFENAGKDVLTAMEHMTTLTAKIHKPGSSNGRDVLPVSKRLQRKRNAMSAQLDLQCLSSVRS